MNRYPEPPGSESQLRQFGFALGVLLVVCAWLAYSERPWLAGTFVVVAGVAIAIAWVLPNLLRPSYRIALLVTRPLGMVLGELALLGFYCGCILPMGLFAKAWRRLSHSRADSDQDHSTWQPRVQGHDLEGYFRPW